MNSFEKIKIPRVDITEQELDEYSSKKSKLFQNGNRMIIHDELVNFANILGRAYEGGLLAENPSRSSLYHMLIGSSDPDNKFNWEKFDYEGEYSIRKFIDDQLASLTE